MGRKLQVGLLIVAVPVVIAGGYFAYQTLSLSRTLETRDEEKAQLTQDLAVLKATDQVLRAELLQEKLSTAERDLTTTRQEADQLRARNATLEENAKKLWPYFRAVDAVQQGFYGGDITGSFPEINEAISALGDAGLLERWRSTERIVREDLADGSWSPQPIGNMLTLLLRRIEQFLSAP